VSREAAEQESDTRIVVGAAIPVLAAALHVIGPEFDPSSRFVDE